MKAWLLGLAMGISYVVFWWAITRLLLIDSERWRKSQWKKNNKRKSLR